MTRCEALPRPSRHDGHPYRKACRLENAGHPRLEADDRRARADARRPGGLIAGAAVAAWFAVGLPAVAQNAAEHRPASGGGEASQPAGEWQNYAADSHSSKYSPLDQIHRGNVHELDVAWRWRSIDYGLAELHGAFPPSVFQNTPMMRDGRVLVATGLGAAALDPASGEILWTYDSYQDDAPRNRGRDSVRGGVTWNDGHRRRIFFTGNGRLTALDANTGRLDPDFGDGGKADMLDTGGDAMRTGYFWSSAPVVCGDTIVVGESTLDSWSRRKNPKGIIRGFDARSGDLRWTFNIVPEPGDFGFDTWASEEAADAGAANVWTWISCDQDLGLAYAATSTPSNDWYGGHRPGKGLFGEAILALDATTGERRWHFQAVHHGLWDYDFPAAPVLADIVVDGRQIKALAQPSKQAFLYVLDRESGKDVWPIVELPAPPSDVPGEQAWPTQPHPTWPLPYDLQGLTTDDLIDFTPELRAMAMEYVSRFRIGQIFLPPSLIDGPDALPTIQVPGPVGGSNWNGAALDPETNVLYVPSVTVPGIMGLRAPPDPARSNVRYRVDLSEADGYAWATLPNGLPITKPPYGRLTAIDLDTGEHLWMTPNGDGPRDHPALAHLDLPRLGQPGRVSALVTKTLVFLADGSDSMVVQPESGGSPAFRAYDKATGEVVWETELPAGVSGAPMTYLHEGRQYIVMAISGTELEGELLALALPAADDEAPAP